MAGFFAPQTERDPFFEIDQHRLASLVGLVALGMPIALILSIHLDDVCSFESISHFYYSGWPGTVFTGSLFFIGAFLLAYRGDVRSWWEGPLGFLAGLAAFGVAIFPTGGRGCEREQFVARPFAQVDVAESGVALVPQSGTGAFNYFPGAADIHLVSAGVLFVFLAIFCLVIFRRVTDSEHRIGGDPKADLTPNKRRRNRIYLISGLVIVAAVIAMGWNKFWPIDGWVENDTTFYVETIALFAFGVSWLVRGRFFNLFLLDPTEAKTLERE